MQAHPCSFPSGTASLTLPYFQEEYFFFFYFLFLH